LGRTALDETEVGKTASGAGGLAAKAAAPKKAQKKKYEYKKRVVAENFIEKRHTRASRLDYRQAEKFPPEGFHLKARMD